MALDLQMAIISVIILAISIYYLSQQKKKKGLTYFLLILGVLTGIVLLMASTGSFVFLNLGDFFS